jgi:hypothetical protein
MYVPGARHSTSVDPQGSFVEPDALFGALDGRHLVAMGNHWRVEVYSVCDRSGRRWIQLGLEGAQRYLVLLRLSAGDGAASAVSALISWLAHAAMIFRSQLAAI